MDAARSEVLPGVIGGRYRVIDEVGRGSMGRVMRVENLTTGEVVAMKLMLGQDPASHDRFRREARALARIRGEHVVRVLDADLAPELDNAPYLIMELLTGQSLAEYATVRPRMSLGEVAWLVQQTALGLSEVHAAGFVHRDLKPQNIFLERRRAVKLLDFGLVKALRADTDTDATRTGTMLGTPMYMSPEQVHADPASVGVGADVWALGMIAFRLLTGRHYWTAPSIAGILVDIATARMPAPSSIDPTVPAAFDAWFERSCARSIHERWSSAADQGQALADLAAKVEPARPVGLDPDATMTRVTSAQPPPSSRSSGIQRRQVTVMFYTIAPVAPHIEEMDPEEYETLEQRYVRTCAEALGALGDTLSHAAHGGRFVFFGYPVAYGDDARRAVEAGLRLTAAARSLGESSDAAGLAVRVGIHTGLVLVGGSRASGDNQDLVGPTIPVATSLERVAEPNTVLVGATTWRMVGGRFEGEPVGKGPIRVFGRSGAGEGSIAGSMIGRRGEFELASSLLRETLAGRARTLLVTGEPGIGKSRLAQAQRDAASASRIAWIEAHCSPYFQRTAYYPFSHLLGPLLGVTTGSLDHARLVEAVALHELPTDAVTLLEVVLGLPPSDAALIGRLSPQLRRQMTMDVLSQIVVTASRRGPLCLSIEDIHWADPSTLEMLERLAALTDAPLLTMLTSRPEIEAAWRLPETVTVIRLQRLSPGETRQLLLLAAGQDSLPEAVLHDLVQRTDGVPLFVEEMGRLLAGKRDALSGAITASVVASLVSAASSLRDSLNARLDRLGDARALVELASVLGNEFTHDDLRALSTEPRFEAMFRGLLDESIVQARGPEGCFAFRHALLRDAAYEALPRDTRKQAHGRAAQVLGARGGARPELLAHHLAEAGLLIPAAGLLVQAGQDALERAANAEAVAHFRRGAEVVGPAMPSPEAVGLRITHHTLEGFAWIVQRGYAVPEVEAAFGKAGALLAAVGTEPPVELLPALWGQWVLTLVRGRFAEAEQHSAGLLRLAERVPDPGVAMLAHLARGTSLHGLGRFAEACTFLERAIAAHDPVAHGAYRFMYGQDPLMFGKIFLAWALWAMGQPDRAATLASEAIEHSRRLQHPNSLGFALALSALIHHDRGEPGFVLERVAALRDLSATQGWLQWSAHALLWNGAALVEQGALTEGLAQIRQGGAPWPPRSASDRAPATTTAC